MCIIIPLGERKCTILATVYSTNAVNSLSIQFLSYFIKIRIQQLKH